MTVQLKMTLINLFRYINPAKVLSLVLVLSSEVFPSLFRKISLKLFSDGFCFFRPYMPIHPEVTGVEKGL